jgi:hypothetical protein
VFQSGDHHCERLGQPQDAVLLIGVGYVVGQGPDLGDTPAGPVDPFRGRSIWLVGATERRSCRLVRR